VAKGGEKSIPGSAFRSAEDGKEDFHASYSTERSYECQKGGKLEHMTMQKQRSRNQNRPCGVVGESRRYEGWNKIEGSFARSKVKAFGREGHVIVRA